MSVLSKPEVPSWIPARETELIQDSEYLDLEVVDISSLIADPLTTSTAARDTIDRAFRSLQETGFVILTGHGFSSEALGRQFDLGNMFLEVSEEVKHQYHAKIWEEGSWAGYKPLGFYNRKNGARDTIESHDFYPYTVVNELQPPVSWPYLDEIRSFYKVNLGDASKSSTFKPSYVCSKPTLFYCAQYCQLSREDLGFPQIEYFSFWQLHHRACEKADEIQTRDLFRAVKYHPPSEEDRLRSEQLWLPPHTDRGSITFLYSQPVAGLQVFMNHSWKYVRYYPGGIIVNLGDAMDFTTGGLLKAALHRVYEPPADQRHLPRLGLFYFATMLPDIPMQPLEPLTARARPPVEGTFDEFEGKIPTAHEWQIKRAKSTGRPADGVLFAKRFPKQDSAVYSKT
ncbi:hypothetical protein D9615_007173 [Tricholomella constricta]|uniref:Clavaminate synthase-like protein n=1 Tax=Tricholomella constricta TaxID=117010 RepID=A0A8H5M2P6_9AGAR|nr:hypothetical protein D9615_007173 [Tricholomella constricta]